ncbi:hypothetical protein BH18THE2_BH18THE2_15780 [soil metagenome]
MSIRNLFPHEGFELKLYPTMFSDSTVFRFAIETKMLSGPFIG